MKILDDRRAGIQNEENKKITNNKTIMEHSLERAKEKVRPKGIISKINHARLWKKSTLPCEIVGINGNSITK